MNIPSSVSSASPSTRQQPADIDSFTTHAVATVESNEVVTNTPKNPSFDTDMTTNEQQTAATAVPVAGRPKRDLDHDGDDIEVCSGDIIPHEKYQRKILDCGHDDGNNDATMQWSQSSSNESDGVMAQIDIHLLQPQLKSTSFQMDVSALLTKEDALQQRHQIIKSDDVTMEEQSTMTDTIQISIFQSSTQRMGHKSGHLYV